MNDFFCDLCKIKKPHDFEWTEEDRLREKNNNFPDIPISSCGTVCTDCFVVVMLWAEKSHRHSTSWRIGYEEVIKEIEAQEDQGRGYDRMKRKKNES